ncbi:hypothetical protein DKX38_005908 [Salix brachista]|uniref:Uncharacterized protein n=1 Tax=Salix brachista TaxID=2182728 RepID=A0A5N5N3B3_9ROSI|nr:hypothetical protein DKX38_005908 [Salix brachista]
MIKRRFFKAEHGEKDEASSDSSSSSSDSEADATEQSEDDVVADPEKNSESEDDDKVAEPKEVSESEASSSSGYESEDSSANVIDGYSSALAQVKMFCSCGWSLTNSSYDINTRTGIEILKKQSNATAEESVPDDVPDCILKCKSVYKCRICPRIICLTEETMRTHLISKRHARSEKLMKENRLKVMLNIDNYLFLWPLQFFEWRERQMKRQNASSNFGSHSHRKKGRKGEGAERESPWEKRRDCRVRGTETRWESERDGGQIGE